MRLPYCIENSSTENDGRRFLRRLNLSQPWADLRYGDDGGDQKNNHGRQMGEMMNQNSLSERFLTLIWPSPTGRLLLLAVAGVIMLSACNQPLIPFPGADVPADPDIPQVRDPFPFEGWWVAPEGDDLNDCRSRPNPCLTIQAAVDKASSGGRIFVLSNRFYMESIHIDKSLTLTALEVGGRGVYINGGTERCLTIGSDGGSSNRVQIEGLMLSGCSADRGAGIYIYPNQIVTLQNVEIRNSYADIEGGAIWNAGVTTLISSGMDRNQDRSQERGTHIYNVGTLRMEDGWTGEPRTIPAFGDNSISMFNDVGGVLQLDGAYVSPYFETAIVNHGELTATDAFIVAEYEGEAFSGLINFGHAEFIRTEIGGFARYGIDNKSGAEVSFRDSFFELNTTAIRNAGVASIVRATIEKGVIRPHATLTDGIAFTNLPGSVAELENVTIAEHGAPEGDLAAVIYNNGGTLQLRSASIINTQAPSRLPDHAILTDAGGMTSLQNTIVGGTNANDCEGPIMSEGNNLFDDDSCGPDSALGDLTVSSIDRLMLGELADNGGPSRTLALLTASPAIDTGAECPSEDQRGTHRPIGGACDIGAYEYEFASTSDESDLVEIPEAEPTGPTTCRFGPRPIYPPISYLSEGQTVQLISRNGEGTWVEVESLDGLVGPCWVDVGLLEVPELVDVMELDEGYIPPEPTLTPTPASDEPSGGGSRPPCLLPDPKSPQSNVQYICHASCPVPNDQAFGTCTP